MPPSCEAERGKERSAIVSGWKSAHPESEINERCLREADADSFEAWILRNEWSKCESQRADDLHFTGDSAQNQRTFARRDHDASRQRLIRVRTESTKSR